MTDHLAIVQDQLLQRGGTERVILEIARAFPDVPIYTSVYLPEATFEEFSSLDVRPLISDTAGLFRGDHRRALPLLAVLFSRARIEADVVVCNSAGWSHGVRTSGRKLVYCHTPARWLYNFADVRNDLDGVSRRMAHLAAPAFRRWDRWAAESADRYLANCKNVRERIESVYGWSAPVLYPPVRLGVDEPATPVERLDPGFLLTISRLQTYKNVGTILDTARLAPHERFVVAGDGPLLTQLRRDRPDNVTILGGVDDATLRWLYQSCAMLLAPAYEDFGLTPIEAAGFGKPTAALRWGGHLETILPGETGVFFEDPDAGAVAKAIAEARSIDWNATRIADHAQRFSPEAFTAQLVGHIDELLPGHARTGTT